MLRCEKGQLVMYDLFFACVTFIFLLGAFYVIWNYNVATVQQETVQSLAGRDSAILDALVRSPGEPQNWEKPGGLPEIIGLAERDRVLDADKVSAFAALAAADYNASKTLLKTAGHGYLFELDGVDDLNIGQQPTANVYKVRLSRIVTYKGDVANVALTLYTAR